MRRRQLRQVTSTLGISAQAVREDRILHEALATCGDIRRLGTYQRRATKTVIAVQVRAGGQAASGTVSRTFPGTRVQVDSVPGAGGRRWVRGQD
jgi:hypothetical protein